jgi:CheY-like chemotaxis protein
MRNDWPLLDIFRGGKRNSGSILPTPRKMGMKAEPTVLLATPRTTNEHPIQDALEQGGYRVLPVSSGEEAHGKIWAKDANIAAVVTDVMLEGEEAGWEVAREARKHNSTIPVIYMTPDGSHDWAYLGVPDSLLLRTPVTAAQLVSAVSSLLNEAESTRHPDGG